jgi:hypothetical protein
MLERACALTVAHDVARSKQCVRRIQPRQQPKAGDGSRSSATLLGGLDRAAPTRPQALHRAAHAQLSSEEELMSRQLAFSARACLLVLAASLGPTIGAGLAFGRDASRAERIRGDDDPILISRWVASGSLMLDARDVPELDPETTGSVKKQARRSRPRCDTLVWFPDRKPGDDTREAC